jgi:hypothetical protein
MTTPVLVMRLPSAAARKRVAAFAIVMMVSFPRRTLFVLVALSRIASIDDPTDFI